MSFSYDTIDFNSLDCEELKQNITEYEVSDKYNEYDKTTTESYRIKRIFKIDPIIDIEVPEELSFKFQDTWNPYNGMREKIDPIGPLYFNAINLYDYFYLNRFKGLWNSPEGQFQGYYGDLVGTSKNINIKSRGSNPERYLYRLPIIDCYLSPNHNYSIVTMGPELTENEISQIDLVF